MTATSPQLRSGPTRSAASHALSCTAEHLKTRSWEFETTALGLRRDHLLVEILAVFADRPDELEEKRHQQWVRAALQDFAAIALPGGYPNLLAPGDEDRAAKGYGRNASRLVKAKRHYDPDDVFSSAIPLPASRVLARAS